MVFERLIGNVRAFSLSAVIGTDVTIASWVRRCMLRLKMRDGLEQAKPWERVLRAFNRQRLLHSPLLWSCRPPTWSNQVNYNTVRSRYFESKLTPTVHHSPHVIRSFSVNSSSSVRTKEFPTVGKVDLSRFIVALTSFNIPADVQVDVSASITTPVDTGFTVSLSDTSISPASTGVDSATCSWIELGAHAADMQCGSLRRNDNPDADLLKRTTTHQVSFPMTYSEPPQVVVWLRGLHLSPSDQRTVKLQVVQIYNWGFNLEVICGTAANPHDVEISWLACLAGVTTGDFAGGNVSGVTKCEGYFAFKAGRFETPPRVVAGLTGFGNNKQVAFSLAVRVVQVTCEGVKWRIDGGPDGHFGFAKGSFIAFE